MKAVAVMCIVLEVYIKYDVSNMTAQTKSSIVCIDCYKIVLFYIFFRYM